MAFLKRIFVVQCLALALVSVFSQGVDANSSGEEPDFDCSGLRDGNYPNPENCTTFFNCKKEKAKVKHCPNPLYFNPRYGMCDLPEHAGCAAATSTTTTTTPPPLFKCEGRADGTYPHPFDCEYYIRCHKGDSLIIKCPLGFHYSYEEKLCDWPYNAKCEVSLPDPDPETDFDCSGRLDGNYANPTNCSTFYSCVAGVVKYEMACPAGLHYRPSTDSCEYPADAECEVSNTTTTRPTTTITTTTTTTTPTTTTSTTTPTTTTPTTTTPTTTTPTTTTTTPTTTTTTPTTTTTTPTTTTTTPTTTTPWPDYGFNCTDLSNGNYPNPANCSTYFTCTEGRTEFMPCYDDLHYNPVTEQCDFPWLAGCDPSYTTDLPSSTVVEETETPTDSTPGEQPTTTTEEDATTTSRPDYGFNCWGMKDGNYPNPNDCTTFFSCSGGITSLMDCPSDLHYNHEQDKCLYPWEAGCDPNYSTIPDNYTTTTDPSPTDSSTGETTEVSGEVETTTMGEEPPSSTDSSTQASTSEDYHDSTTGSDDRETSTITQEPIETTTEEDEVTTTITPNTTVTPITTTVRPITTTHDPSDFCWGKPCGTYPSPDACHEYIICENETSTVHTCPPPLLFNPDILTCDLPERVDCFSCQGRENGIYPNDKNCMTFFMCSCSGVDSPFGEPVLYNCPDNLVFRPDSFFCDCRENAERFCTHNEFPPTDTTPEEQPETTTERATTTTPRPDGFNCTGMQDGNYPNPANCSTYYACSGGITSFMPCPSGLHYNPDQDRCLNPWEAGCDPNYSTTDDGDSTSAGPNPTDSPTEETTEDDGEIETTTMEQEPPSTTTADDITEAPADSTAQSEATTSGNEETTGPVLTDSPGEGTTEEEFETTTQEEELPGSTVAEDTEMPTRSTAGEQPDTTSEEDVSTTSRPDYGFNCWGMKDGNYPNPNDCTTFFSCSGGITSLMDCPSDLHYNHEQDKCLYPWEAGCDPNYSTIPDDVNSTTWSNPTDSPTQETTEDGEIETTTMDEELPGSTVAEDTETPTRSTAGEQPETTAEEDATTTPRPDPGFNCWGMEDGNYPNPANCSTYYACSGGTTSFMPCPSDLHYNHEQNKCLYRWEAGCDPNYSTIPDDATTNAESNPTDSPPEGTTGNDGEIETTTMDQEPPRNTTVVEWPTEVA